MEQVVAERMDAVMRMTPSALSMVRLLLRCYGYAETQEALKTIWPDERVKYVLQQVNYQNN